jgi:nicotinate-nucleotide--dimethylbenzimidazole phosphoribosyltransferase
VELAVVCCAVCRTDAKMWRSGHRDLVLPRVLGHELVGTDPTDGKLYAVWPGAVCGACTYCRAGRDNLCEHMRIIGFHRDGGFARKVIVPRASLIPVPDGLAPSIATFAEPVGCLENGLTCLSPQGGERAIVYGGGTLGMLAALWLRERGCRVAVIEKSAEKLGRLAAWCGRNGIAAAQDTVESDFDLAITCCSDPLAYSMALTKLGKGGRMCYFSGLNKNEQVEGNLLNLIHYRELAVYGSYGLRRSDMGRALAFCRRQAKNLEGLIEQRLDLAELEATLPRILSGQALRYVLDFSQPCQIPKPPLPTEAKATKVQPTLTQLLSRLIDTISPTSPEVRLRAQTKVDQKTKPLGALGRIEQLAVRLSAMQDSLDPRVTDKRLFVFAGDHGVVEEGVSAFPAKVTVQMVENFLGGGAAINVFCRQYDIELWVVDSGVAGDFGDHPQLLRHKVGRGTANFALGPAMSREQALQAIEEGARAFVEQQQRLPCTLVGMGEMGIGNSSSATAVICAASGLDAAGVAGRGTGVDDCGLARKIAVINRALALHRLDSTDAVEILARVGGYELGGICGAVLAAAAHRCCVVLDGIISTAAGLLAYLLCPTVADYLVAGHRSVERGQAEALRLMGLEPVLDLDLRLGEGTGAAITMNLVDLACTMMREMASFEEAGVDSGSISRT